MAETREDEIRQLVDRLFRAESNRILATLIRLLGEFDLAEEAMQDAFAAALVRWSRDGAPDSMLRSRELQNNSRHKQAASQYQIMRVWKMTSCD